MARQPAHPQPQDGDSFPDRRPSGDPERQGGVPAADAPSSARNGLTPVHLGIHCAAAAGGKEGNAELDEIAVNHFLDTLAQVALSIASRKQQKGKG